KSPIPVLEKPSGKGRVVIVARPVLQPALAEISHQRQLAYAFLCQLAGATYEFTPGLQHPKAPGFGAIALATTGPSPTVLPAFEDDEQAWNAFTAKGGFHELGDA